MPTNPTDRASHGAEDARAEVVALGEEHRGPFVVADPRRIATAAIRQVGSEEHVESKVRECALERHEPHALQHDISLRIGEYLLFDAIAVVDGGVANLVRRLTECVLQLLGTGIPLFLGEVGLTISHEEPKIVGACVVNDSRSR